MQLWTYHPSTFPLDAAHVVVDSRKGRYWLQPPAKDFIYREVAPRLWQLLGTDQFIWCFTIPGTGFRATEDDDLVAWELDSQSVEVLAYIDAQLWESIVTGKEECWKNLLLLDAPKVGSGLVHALVKVPLPLGAAACLGQVEPQWTRAQEERMRRVRAEQRAIDPKITEQYDWDE